METFSIQITEPAEEDLRDISSYIAKELLEPEIAKNVIDKIVATINSLEKMPLRNPVVMDEGLALKGIRKIIMNNYIIFYIVKNENKEVVIVRILSNRRNWLHLL